MKQYQQIILGMIIGIFLGYIFPSVHVLTDPIGTVFIKLLKLLVVPLVFASLISGVMGVGEGKSLGRLGVKTLLYFIITTIVSITVGLILVTWIKPGAGTSLIAPTFTKNIAPPSTVSEILTGIVPTNILGALAQGDMLSVIFSALLIGFGLHKMKQTAKPIVDFIESINTLMMTLTQWIIAISPIGVLALMASLTAQMGLQAILPLGRYIGVILAGLIIYGVLIVPTMVIVFTRQNPLKILSVMGTALATAFSTASSAAALPITLKTLTEDLKVSNRVSSFFMSLGITMNMDGTALYQGVAVVFIAQFYGIELTLVSYLMIILTAVFASIGAAAIPSAGLITMTMILNAVGVPIEGLALILGVDRLLDMCRTSVNLWANACGTYIIGYSEKEIGQ